MHVAVHWQDADSSSANAVCEVFPGAKIMICGRHAGRAHQKTLEMRHKVKMVSKTIVDKYFLVWVSSAVNMRGATAALHVGALFHKHTLISSGF